MIPVSRPFLTPEDLASVNFALEMTYISGESPPIKEMENLLAEKVGTTHAVAVSSGTSALDLAVESLNLPPKSRVIVPAFTIVSTVTQLLRKGFEVHLVDSDALTWSMDSEKATELISDEISLIVPVHIYGLPVDMDPIIEKSKKYGTLILEDAAEALGLEYKGRPAGSLGNLSTFSFYANKIVTAGEGGAICTDDIEIASRLRSLRNICFNPNQRYVHEELGWNNRLGGMQASLIYSQLGRLHELVEKKQSQARLYLDGLKDHPWFNFQPPSTSYSENVYWVFGVLLTDDCPHNAEEFQLLLRAHEVDSRRFFCPLNLQPFSKNYPVFQNDNLFVAEKLWNRGLYLPSGLGISDTEIEQVIGVLWELIR